jgi:GR25 family glycosyltransferase involved in LPS biosynthesis
MNNQIIVLNLKRSEDRKKILEEQFKKLGLDNYTFFPAFDGKDNINMSFSVPILKGSGMGRKLERSEIAVIMSHLGALKHAQIMGYDNIVILEDDVVLCEDWIKRFDQLMKICPENCEYIYLSGHSDYIKIPMYDKPTLIEAPQMIGAFSYWTNKIGIEKLIKYCGEFITTYDDMIMHKIFSKKLIGYTYIPFMTYHAGKESLIWDKTPGHLSHSNNMHSSYNYFKNKI